MSMRAQISLMFDDENLFDNFITPYKNEKLLNSLIIRCLSAYYYNEEVRNLIEGTSIEDTVSEEVTSNQEIINSIRASLVMQDFFASELQNTIDNGTEDISNILNRTNTVAEKSGVAKPTPSEYGSGVLRIEHKNVDFGKFTQEGQQPTNTGASDDTLMILLQAVSKLAEASGNSEVVSMLHPRRGVEPSVVSPVQENSSSSGVVSDFRFEENVEEQISVSPEISQPKVVETPKPVVETPKPVVEQPKPVVIETPTTPPVVENKFVEEIPVQVNNDFGVVSSPAETVSAESNSLEDASAAMSELLGSLF